MTVIYHNVQVDSYLQNGSSGIVNLSKTSNQHEALAIAYYFFWEPHVLKGRFKFAFVCIWSVTLGKQLFSTHYM